MDSYSSASEIPDLLQFLRPPVKTFYGHRPTRGDLDRNYRNHRFGRLREDRHKTELRSSSSLVLKETTQTSTQREYRVSRGSVTDIHYPCQFFPNHLVQPKKYADKREQTVKVKPGEVKTTKKLKKINQSTRRNQTTFQPKFVETFNVFGVGSGRKIHEAKTPAYIAETRFRRHLPNEEENFTRSSWHFKRVISAMKMEMKKRKMREESEQKHARIVIRDGDDVPQQCMCSSKNKYDEAIKQYADRGYKSKVKISGQLGLTEDDKYVLRCAARIDDEPIETQCEYFNTNRDNVQQTSFSSGSRPKQIVATASDKYVCGDEDCPFIFRCQRTTYAQTDMKDDVNKNELNANRKESKCIQVNLSFALPGIEDKSNQNDALSQCNCKHTAHTETFIGHDNANSSKNPLVIISVYPKTDVNDDSIDISTAKNNQKYTSKKINNDKARQTSLPQASSPRRESSPRRSIKDMSPKKKLTPKKDLSPSRSKDIAKRDTTPSRDKTPKRYQSPIKGNSPTRDKSPASTSSKSTSSKTVPPRPQQKIAPKDNKTEISTSHKNKVKTITTTSSKVNTKQATTRTAVTKKEIGNKAKPKHTTPIKTTIDSLESGNINRTKKALVESFTRELSSHLDKNELVETIHTNTPKSTGFSNVSVNIDGPKEQYSLFFSNENFTIKKKVKNQEIQQKFTTEEQNSISMVNFLMGPDEERKRSFSQTVILPNDILNAPPPKREPKTSAIKVKDSIEISHRREGRTTSQLTEVTDENDADELKKHFTGDNCCLRDPVARDKEIRELLGVDTGRPSASNNKTSSKSKAKENIFFPEWMDYEIFRYFSSPAAPKTKRDIKIAEILNIKSPVACQEANEGTHSKMIFTSSQNDKTFNELIQQFEVYKSHNVRDKYSKERPISMSRKEFDRIKLLIHHNLSKRYNERRKLRVIKKTSRNSMAVQCSSRKINKHQILQATEIGKRTASSLRSKIPSTENLINSSKLSIQPTFTNKATSCSHYQTSSNIEKPVATKTEFTRKKEILEKALQKTVFSRPKPEKRKETPNTVVVFREDEIKRFNMDKENYLRRERPTPCYQRQPIVHISYAIMKSITFSSTSIPRVAPPARGKGSVKSNMGLHDLEPPDSLRNEFHDQTTDWMGYPRENSLKTKYSIHTLFKGKSRNRSIYVTPNTESINSMYPEEGSRVFRRPPKSKDISKEIKTEQKKPLLRRIWSCLVMRTTKDVVTKEKSLEKVSTDSVSLDSYHLNTSIDPREISSSMYDTTASFYTNHSIRAVPNRMKKKTFMGIFKVLR